MFGSWHFGKQELERAPLLRHQDNVIDRRPILFATGKGMNPTGGISRPVPRDLQPSPRRGLHWV